MEARDSSRVGQEAQIERSARLPRSSSSLLFLARSPAKKGKEKKWCASSFCHPRRRQLSLYCMKKPTSKKSFSNKLIRSYNAFSETALRSDGCTRAMPRRGVSEGALPRSEPDALGPAPSTRRVLAGSTRARCTGEICARYYLFSTYFVSRRCAAATSSDSARRLEQLARHGTALPRTRASRCHCRTTRLNNSNFTRMALHLHPTFTARSSFVPSLHPGRAARLFRHRVVLHERPRYLALGSALRVFSPVSPRFFSIRSCFLLSFFYSSVRLDA